jgi:hypothetical protein
VPQRASESIEPPDDDRVAGAGGRERRGEPGPVATSSAAVMGLAVSAAPALLQGVQPTLNQREPI